MSSVIRFVVLIVSAISLSKAALAGGGTVSEGGPQCGTTIDGNRDNECPSAPASRPRHTSPVKNVPAVLMCPERIDFRGTYETDESRDSAVHSETVIALEAVVEDVNMDNFQRGNETCDYRVTKASVQTDGVNVVAIPAGLLKFGIYSSMPQARLDLTLGGRAATVSLVRLSDSRATLEGDLSFADGSTMSRVDSARNDFLKVSETKVSVPVH